MIFDAHVIPFVRRGKRTTVELPLRRDGDGYVLPCRYDVGESYVLEVRVPRVEYEDGRPPERARIKQTESRVRVLEVERAENAWRVVVELDHEEEPRWMHRFSEKGYTSSRRDALPGELEAVDDATLERYARVNRERHEDFRVRQETRSLAVRLAALERLAAAGLDVRHQFMAIERRIRAAERKANQRAA